MNQTRSCLFLLAIGKYKFSDESPLRLFGARFGGAVDRRSEG
jgi:hypothetical protein